MGGMMSVTGLPGQGPVRAGIPLADLSSGLFAAIGILIALLDREATGTGQWVGGRLRFEGVASAAPDRLEALSNLLNIIGRRDGARSVIKVG